MLNIVFTEGDVTALRYWRFQHPDPRVQVRMEALYLRSQGVGTGAIVRLCGISKASFHRSLKAYVAGGVEQLKRIEHYRPQRELVDHRTTLAAYVQQSPPATGAEAAAKIAEVTEIVRNPTQVRQFLRALGMKPMKVGMIPAKVDVDAEEAFKKKPGATMTGSWGWPAHRVFHGCGPLCVRTLFRHRLVFPTAVCQRPLWAAAGECGSSPECDHPRGVNGPESDGHYRGDGV